MKFRVTSRWKGCDRVKNWEMKGIRSLAGREKNFTIEMKSLEKLIGVLVR